MFKTNNSIDRKQHEKKSKEKIDDMQEKLSVATATLQQAIGGMSAQMTSQNEKVKHYIS